MVSAPGLWPAARPAVAAASGFPHASVLRSARQFTTSGGETTRGGWFMAGGEGPMASSTRSLAAAVWEALLSRSTVERCHREEVTTALVLFREETAGGGIIVRVLPSVGHFFYSMIEVFKP